MLPLKREEEFFRTSRFMSIKAVTQEYYQKYLLMLTKLPYKYRQSPSLHISPPDSLLPAIRKHIPGPELNCLQLTAIREGLHLVQANHWAATHDMRTLSQMIDFEQLISRPLPPEIPLQLATTLSLRDTVLGVVADTKG